MLDSRPPTVIGPDVPMARKADAAKRAFQARPANMGEARTGNLQPGSRCGRGRAIGASLATRACNFGPATGRLDPPLRRRQPNPPLPLPQSWRQETGARGLPLARGHQAPINWCNFRKPIVRSVGPKRHLLWCRSAGIRKPGGPAVPPLRNKKTGCSDMVFRQRAGRQIIACALRDAETGDEKQPPRAGFLSLDQKSRTPAAHSSLAPNPFPPTCNPIPSLRPPLRHPPLIKCHDHFFQLSTGILRQPRLNQVPRAA